jgi:hypothetical protein
MSSDCQGIDISKLISWLLLVSNYLAWQVLFGHLKEEKTEARIKGWRRKMDQMKLAERGQSTLQLSHNLITLWKIFGCQIYF